MAVLMVVSGITTIRRNSRILRGEETLIDCVIALSGNPSNVMSLSTGFHYELLRKAENILSGHFEIRLRECGENVLDSLSEGKIRLAVLPAKDSALQSRSGIICSRMFPDSTVWAVSEDGILCNSLDYVYMRLTASDDFQRTVQRFTPSYEPFKRVRSGKKVWSDASPYDELLKASAKELGWDWRLLTAVVWQESMFRIEARSHRGAEGLMQVMPHTATHFNAEDELLDPRRNLEAGTGYLKRLMRLFSDIAANEEELIPITLAAYNAGEGRIRECLLYARAKGLEGNKWDDIKAIIPDLRDGDVMIGDSVVIGTFQGYETLAYVARTDSLYQAFKIIAP